MDYNKIYNEIALKKKVETVEKYKILNQYIKKNENLFVGSSLMEEFPINEFLMNFNLDYIIYNRAVSGYTTTELIKVLDTCIFDLEPKKIFINIGSNDIACEGYTVDALIENYRYILNQIKTRHPDTKVYIMAYYPVNELDDFIGKSDKGWFIQRNNNNISIANTYVKDLASEFKYEYINLNKGLSDLKGQLKKDYTIEGIHMYANGYRAVFEEMLPYLSR